MKETKNGGSQEVQYLTDADKKIGTNIIPEDIYNDMKDNPKLCGEIGQYYDRKTKRYHKVSTAVHSIIYNKNFNNYSHSF